MVTSSPIPARFLDAKRAGLSLALALLAGTALAPAAQAESLTQYSLSNPNNGDAFAAPVQARDGYLYGIMGDNTPTIYISSPGGKITTQLVGSTDPSYYVCYTGMILGRDGNFYGTCNLAGDGTQDFAFRYTPGGHGAPGTFTPFAVITPNADYGTRSPSALVQASDGNFYGTTFGGRGLVGSVFRITPAGVVTTLQTFTNSAGPYSPTGPLIEARDGKLYGTSEGGSTVCCGNGTIYSVTLKGKVSVFYNFDGTDSVQSPDWGVIQGTDGSFYGETGTGGLYDQGSIYKVSPAGVLTDLHDVNQTTDGSISPRYGVLQATDGNFYGVLSGCTDSGCGPGALFEMTGAGSFSTLFTIDIPPGGCQFAPPGCIPASADIEHTNGKLYGVFEQGGNADQGVLYAEIPRHLLRKNVSLQETRGSAGSTIDILGQGFRGATAVKFGAVSASFATHSDTHLTATVPTGATTSYVTVLEPSGTLKSQQKFIVN